MWLLIDDMRSLPGVEVIARTPKAARKMLSLGGWTNVIFDHDLGYLDEESKIAETGYDILKWAIEERLLPDKIELITSNPVGRENMAAALVADGYIRRNVVFFSKE